MPAALFSKSEARVHHVVSRYISRTVLLIGNAHMHTCMHAHSYMALCVHSGTLLHVNYAHKL